MMIIIFNSCSTLNYNQRLNFDKDDSSYVQSNYYFMYDNYEKHTFKLSDIDFTIAFYGNKKNILFSPIPLIPLFPSAIFKSHQTLANRIDNSEFYITLSLDVFTEHNIQIDKSKIKMLIDDSIYNSAFTGNNLYTNEEKLKNRSTIEYYINEKKWDKDDGWLGMKKEITAVTFDKNKNEVNEFQLQIDSVVIDGKNTNITFPKMKISNRLVYRPLVIYTH